MRREGDVGRPQRASGFAELGVDGLEEFAVGVARVFPEHDAGEFLRADVLALELEGFGVFVGDEDFLLGVVEVGDFCDVVPIAGEA